MSKAHTETYRPELSHLGDNELITWLSTAKLDDLKVIPGLGMKTEEALKSYTQNCENPITSAYALVGLFINMKQAHMGRIDHINMFYDFLKKAGVHGSIHTIIRAVAERAKLTFPGLYDHSDWVSHMNVNEKVIIEQVSATRKSVKN